jgi:hypothetical protein
LECWQWVWGRRRTNCKWRQWHWLVKADWTWHALCIKCVKLIVKYFVLEDFLFLRVSSKVWIYIHFPLAEIFYLGGYLRIESSCIWVNMVYYCILHNIVFSKFIPAACECIMLKLTVCLHKCGQLEAPSHTEKWNSLVICNTDSVKAWSAKWIVTDKCV